MSTGNYELSKGFHPTAESGRCAMEWVSYLAGEKHSDSPACVSPVLQKFAIYLNDTWDYQLRQKLRPYLARCIGTAGDDRDEERAYMALDWLVRVCTPAFLDFTPALVEHAQRLRACPTTTGPVGRETMEALAAARDAARDAAVDAAVAAAVDAAGAAAVAAAVDAAGAAAVAAAVDAAVDAAGDAARAAAVDAAVAAARDAAGAATVDAAVAAARDAAGAATGAAAGAAARTRADLGPVVQTLQASALDLFDRMLPKELIDMPAVGLDEAEAVCGVPLGVQ